MNHLHVSIVEKKFLKLPRLVEIIVRTALFPYMWMVKYQEIEKLLVDEKCILLLMKSKTDNSKYISSVNNAEKNIGIKEPMMTV